MDPKTIQKTMLIECDRIGDGKTQKTAWRPAIADDPDVDFNVKEEDKVNKKYVIDIAFKDNKEGTKEALIKAEHQFISKL